MTKIISGNPYFTDSAHRAYDEGKKAQRDSSDEEWEKMIDEELIAWLLDAGLVPEDDFETFLLPRWQALKSKGE